MKKKLVIELILYIILVLVGVVLLLTYKPDKKEIVIPQDFQIQWEGVSD